MIAAISRASLRFSVSNASAVEPRLEQAGSPRAAASRPVSSATIRKLCSRPQGPIRSPAATTSGTSTPSARARSRWANSAAPGVWRPRGSNQGREPRRPGEPVMPLQVDRHRPVRARGRRRGPSIGPAWRGAGRGFEVHDRLVEVGRQGVADSARRARSSGVPRTSRCQKVPWLGRHRLQALPRLGPFVPVDPDADRLAPLRARGSPRPAPRHRRARRGASRPAARGRQFVVADDDVSQVRVGERLADVPVVVGSAGPRRTPPSRGCRAPPRPAFAWPASHCPAAQCPQRLGCAGLNWSGTETDQARGSSATAATRACFGRQPQLQTASPRAQTNTPAAAQGSESVTSVSMCRLER